ncbi:hypothetical protein PPERSA_08644 [Pseudocohnilembus persalinus]|uniref:Uncharacterized protein n=1 Tax=Pseudocohnilembus persalinus TaxID=266149 RepID=A0A0V0R561_PSEPJ|nr:hypothetical protein PPERSA_08644 [Pseudocohnilembus persalinus]|eukprot:KRX09612.1 hypothetical protein PPERSA_08644 [Pseudocohnilembus persalinus]
MFNYKLGPKRILKSGSNEKNQEKFQIFDLKENQQINNNDQNKNPSKIDISNPEQDPKNKEANQTKNNQNPQKLNEEQIQLQNQNQNNQNQNNQNNQKNQKNQNNRKKQYQLQYPKSETNFDWQIENYKNINKQLLQCPYSYMLHFIEMETKRISHFLQQNSELNNLHQKYVSNLKEELIKLIDEIQKRKRDVPVIMEENPQNISEIIKNSIIKKIGQEFSQKYNNLKEIERQQTFDPKLKELVINVFKQLETYSQNYISSIEEQRELGQQSEQLFEPLNDRIKLKKKENLEIISVQNQKLVQIQQEKQKCTKIYQKLYQTYFGQESQEFEQKYDPKNYFAKQTYDKQLDQDIEKYRQLYYEKKQEIKQKQEIENQHIQDNQIQA